MKSAQPHIRHPAPSQRGVTLIEALVALLVMSFGMVALVGLMANLRRGGDIAKQRGEAMRLAQEELATLRSFGVLTRAAGDTTTLDYDNVIATVDPRVVSIDNSNTSFTISRGVTPLVKDSAEPAARTMSVTVSWVDRTNAAEPLTLKLDSIVSRTDPAFTGAVGIAPPTNGIRTPDGRNPAIPVDAKDLGDKRSAFRPSGGGGVVWVFNNLTGAITSVCTNLVDTPVSTLTPADVASCTSSVAYFVSGTISFSNTNPANPTTPEGVALPQLSVSMSLVPSQFTEKKGSNYSLIDGRDYPASPKSECFNDSPSSADSRQSFVNYNCIVYPNAQTPRNWWGQVLLGGLSLGTSATQFRVCRYSADYNGNGYTYATYASSGAVGYDFLLNGSPAKFLIDNEEHPEVYRGVTYPLVRQNFLVVRGDVACPTAPAPDPASGIFVNYSTVQLQPGS